MDSSKRPAWLSRAFGEGRLGVTGPYDPDRPAARLRHPDDENRRFAPVVARRLVPGGSDGGRAVAVRHLSSRVKGCASAADSTLVLSVSGLQRSHTYRSVGTFWAALGLTSGGVAFLALAATTGRGRTGVFVIAGVVLLAALRMWMSGIRVEADGVKIASVFLSRRVSWGEIDHFAVMPLGRFPYVGYVVLRDGRKFGTFGLSTSSRQSDANRLQVQRPIDELNRILGDRCGAGGSRVHDVPL